VEYASEELINQDQKITQLRAENNKLKQTNQQLVKDLSLTQRLAELRRTSPLTSEEA
jgi:cell division protein FtsB